MLRIYTLKSLIYTISCFLLFLFASNHKLNAQVTILTEDFEHGSNMPSGWSQEYVKDTLNWVFNNGGNASHPSSAHGGSYNALLYYGGVYRTTKLVTSSINLAAYSNVTLTFWHAMEEYSGDQDYLKVYYKTSATGTWTQLASYTTSVATWTQRTISLSTVSSTYYLAFEGEGRYGYGVCVDDVKITGTVANGLDISCIGINSPVTWKVGSNTLKIDYKNVRSDTIKNADFGYKLDNNTAVIQTNVSTGTMLANQTNTYTFSSGISVSKGKHYIKVWANKPNRKNPDDNPGNDTFTLNFGTGVQDTLIIDSKGKGDYKTFADAIADLNNGVTGKVVFMVKAGTYNEKVILGEIPGANSTNTIVFDGKYADSVILKYTGSSTSDRATLVFKGGDYITFKNMTIKNEGSTYGVAIHMRNKSDYNSFKNCKLEVPANTTNSYSQVILVSSQESTTGTAGDNANNCLFENCTIKSGYYGVVWYGTNTAIPSVNNVFRNCTFTSQYVYGILQYYTSEFAVEQCLLNAFRYNYSYAIINYYGMGSIYNGNIIQPGYIGIYLYLENYYNSNKTTTISNNMISNFSGTSYQLGIYGYYYCYNLKIYHNSFYLDGSSNSPSNNCAINLYYFNDNSVIKNNLFSCNNNSYFYNFYYINNVTVDYNDYYYGSNSSTKFYVNSGSYNFSSYKSTSSYINYPHDQNSYDNVNPVFISKTNLHLDTLNTPSLMVPSVGLTKDIDNQTRSTVIGCNMGADEIRHPSRDLDIISVDSPSVMVMGANTVCVTLRNNGTDSLPIQKIYLSYKINSGSWVNDSLTMSSKLAPFQSLNFSFKTKWTVSSSASHTLCVRIYPTIINDPDATDQVCVSKCVGISGTYTIDPSGKGNYKTFAAALASLQSCGLSGSIKYIVKAGTYVERIEIPEIPGANATNTITFEGVHVDSVMVIYSGGYSSRATLLFNGADWVTFKNMKIQNNGSSYATAVHFKTAADHNTVENCKLIVATGANYYMIPVVFSNAEETYNTAGNTGNYNLVKNCSITGGYFGIVLNGQDKLSLCYGNKFIGNTLTHQYYYGVYMQYESELEFIGNSLTDMDITSGIGIYSYYCTSNKFISNIIQTGYYGFYLYRENDITPGKKTYIVNNMISNFKNSAYHVGIFAYYNSKNLNILHNSIHSDQSTNSWYYANITLYSNCDSAVIKNNILSSSSNGFLLSLYISTGTIVDYNDYYYPGTASYYFFNTYYYADLTGFKSSNSYIAYPHDVNSYDNINPNFKSTDDLHIQANKSGLGGDNTLGITTDIDGDYRCASFPSVGADEAGAVANFTINSTPQCFDGHNFIFTNTSEGGSATLTYSWDFGDSKTSTVKSPTHQYSTPGTYAVKLIITPNKGCRDTIVKNVTVNPSVNGGFTINDDDQCLNGNYFSFTNTSSIGSGTLTYNWNFGDGYFAAVTSPSHSYSNADTFTVTLIVSSGLGCADTIIKDVYVRPLPDADFSINSTIQCSAGNSFNFTNLSTIQSGSMTYNWNFGDASTSTQTSPSHTYSANNTFQVKLVATSNFGCKDSITKNTTVYATPTALFTVNDSSQCLNVNSFSFTNSSSVSSGTLSYLWNFGDNSTSTSATPTHNYSSSGSYIIKLITTTSNGCKDSLSKNVVVHPSLIASFSINDSIQCLNTNNFIFTNSSTSTTGTMSYLWTFGDDSSSSTKNTSHSYLIFGDFNVKMITSSTNGCSDSATKKIEVFPMPLKDKDAAITYSINDSLIAYYPFIKNAQDKSGLGNNGNVYGPISTTDKCSKTDSAYYFDGTNDYIQVAHAYLLNPQDGSISISAWIYPTLNNVSQYIVYKYQSSLYKGYLLRLYNNKVYALFGGQSSQFSSDSTVKLNQWNHIVVSYNGSRYKFFINGKSAGSGYAAFNYSATSVLYIGRQATGNYFQGKIDEVRIYSKALNENDVFALYNSLPIVSVNKSTVCNNENAIIYIENSGNGIEYSLKDTITGNTIGTKTTGNGCKIAVNTGSLTSNVKIKITANDPGSSCSVVFDTVISISIAPYPDALFSINDADQCQKGNSFVFSNLSTISSGSMTYLWKLGDNTTTTSTNTTYSYSISNTYNVNLIVTSNNGCKDSATKSVEVYPMPIASFTIADSTQCFDNNSFTFINSSSITSGSLTYNWDFGDTSYSTVTNPSHHYIYPNSYKVKLLATSAYGCKDSLIKSTYIHVYPVPKAAFLINDSTQCLGLNNFTFTDKSTISSGTYNKTWTFGDGTNSSTTNPTHVYSAYDTFIVKLAIISNLGCKDSVTKNIFVYPDPNSNFSISDSSQCLTGNSFIFSNTATIPYGSIAYLWTFGDGSKSTTKDPTHTYSTADTFTVKLVNISNYGCMDSISKSTFVYPTPVADFIINDNTQCLSGNSFSFTDKSSISSGNMTYNWTFGDGATSTQKDPTHSYSTAGTYNVKLVLFFGSFCKDSLTKSVDVYPKPVAGFNINATTQCLTGNSFSFTNSSSISSGSMSYSWNFGDGNSSTSANPTHSFASSGTYNVKLLTTSANGCKDSMTKTVTVNPMPVANFSINSTNQCLTNNSFSFTNTSSISLGSITYLWSFGDADTSTATSPSHSYTSAGTFNVKLVVTSADNCKDSITKSVTINPMPIAGFSINSSSQCLTGNSFSFSNSSAISSGSMTYYWNFGDGNSSTSANPTHTFASSGTYNVKLLTTSGNGCKDSITKTVTVNPMPIANFSINSTSQCLTNNSFSFTNTSSISSGSITYLWNFGDAGTSTSASPSHSYASAGTFNVKLVVTSADNCKDSITKSVTINPMPIAGFSINSSSQCLTGNSFSFSNSSAISSGSITYFWNFGDGNSSTSANPTHSFASSGTYNVKLLTTSGNGCKDSMTKTVTVNPMPVANFSINSTSQCLTNNSFSFTNTSSISSGSITYLWSFGDAGTSTATSPSHSYASAGTFNVKLVVTSADNCKDSITKSVTINPMPIAGFSINSSSQCLTGNSFSFSNSSAISSGSMTYYWNFGDGNSSTSANPSHSFASSGTYNVKLLTTSGNGCKDSITKTITVNPMPVANFNINSSNQCLTNNSFSLTNTSSISSGSITYLWNFGDAGTSTATSPSHSYASAGTFNVKLVVTSADNCKDSITKSVTINPMPVAGFSINSSSQCLTGNSFSFTNSSAISSGSMTYYWNFGDGNSSTSANPTHTFASSGTYNVKLLTTSGNGCKDSMTKTVTVNPMPIANFSINSTNQCLTNNSFSFTNTSSISSGSITYLWNFGDAGTSTATSPSHSYTSAGTFNVKLIVTSDNGCKDSISKSVTINPVPVAAFSVNASPQCLIGNNFTFTNTSSISAGSMTYSWTFGDGSSSTSTSPNHTYLAAGTYLVKIIVISGNNCIDSIDKTVRVDPMPVAGFNINSTSQCLTGNSFSFTNTSSISSGSLTYLWSFGDNNTSTSSNPSHSYTNAGTFSVKLIVTSDNGCKDSISKIDTILPMPIAGFSINNTDQCFKNNNFSFTNTSTISLGTLKYLWNFGDGDTSSVANPSHKYLTAGTYTIKLKVFSSSGCEDSISKSVSINPMPVAGYTINNTSQCLIGNNFSFTNSSSISTGTLTHFWDFGDGDTSTAFSPGHSYLAAGTYDILLIVNSDKACPDSLKKTVVVNPQPIADFSINANNQCFGSNSFIFTNKSSISSGSISSFWNFGDLDTSGSKNPVHSYATVDTFTVKLLTQSDKGCTDSFSLDVIVLPGPKAGFTVNDTDQCNSGNNFVFTNTTNLYGFSASYLWDFGDGNNSTSTNPSHTYISAGDYKVKLIVKPAAGCGDSFIIPIHIYPQANVGFSINDADQCLKGNSFALTNSSTISKGTISYNWTFGDGNSSILTNPNHAYTSTGSFNIKLLTISDLGCRDSITKLIQVYPNPIAGFSMNDSTQCQRGNLVGFTNSSTGIGINSYKWTLGDGSSSNSSGSFNYSYAKDSAYKVKLVVTTDKACKDSITRTVIIYPQPVSGFTLNATPQCLNENNLIFTNTTTIKSGSTTYLWSFDDASTSTIKNPIHHFISAKVFNVKLVTSSMYGCKDSISKPVTINESPKSNFSINDSSQCFKNNHFVFINKSTIGTGTMTYLWDFGDVYKSTTLNSSHIYLKDGQFTAKLITTSDKGCKDSIVKTTYVRPMPDASFDVNKNPQCFVDNLFMFTDKSTVSSGTVTQLWYYGDGDSTIGGTNVSHSYTTFKPFNVTLYSTTDFGCKDSIFKTITMKASPSTNLGKDKYTILNVLFNLDAGPNFISYLWNDSSTSRIRSINTNDLGLGIHTVWVKVTDSTGCSNYDTILIYVRKSMSLSENNSSLEYRIYPNPARGIVNLEVKGITSINMSVVISEISGKEVYSGSFRNDKTDETFQLDLSGLAKGVYLIKMISGDKSAIDKLMIY